MMRKLKFLVVAACVLVSTAATRADDQSAEQLAQKLRSADVRAQIKACEDLAAMGAKAKAALPALIEAAAGSNVELQWRSALAIGAMGSVAGDAVPALTKALASDNAKVRAYAAHALGKIGAAAQPAAPALVKLSVDEDQYVRRAVRDALPLIGAPRELTRPLMIETLKSADPADATAAILTLSELGAEIVPDLCEALENEQACYWACLALSEIGPEAKAAVPALTKALQSKDPEVRIAALIALGEIGKPSAVANSTISQLLANDEIEGVRYAAAFALGSIGDNESATRALTASLDSENEFLRVAGAWALARLADEETSLIDKAVKIVVEGVTSDDPAVRDLAVRAMADKNIPREVTRPAFRKALRGIKDPAQLDQIVVALASLGADAVPPCVESLQSKSDLRLYAIKVLIRIGPEAAAAVPALIGALQDEDAEIRKEAEFALGAVGPEAAAATSALIKQLTDADADVRHAACYALGKIGPPAKMALPALRKGLSSDDDFQKIVSIWAMLQIDSDKEALAKMAIPVLVETLTNGHKHGDHVRVEAAYELGELGPAAKSALAALKQALNDDNNAVRYAAAVAIEKIEK